MREIKFRGYSKEDEKWYYGYLDKFFQQVVTEFVMQGIMVMQLWKKKV